jgi:clan AA aspartic protease
MRTNEMGKVIVSAKMENLEDLFQHRKGHLPADQIRNVTVPDALIDTGATGLVLPKSLVSQLGLKPVRQRNMRTAAGPMQMNICDAVRLTVQGRDCTLDVYEAPDTVPVLIGQIPLEALDFVVDPLNQRLIGNPDHGGQHMADALGHYE